jgi:outer membrane lipoprotein-sorting protein
MLVDGCIPSKPTEEVEILSSERLINKLEVNRRRIKNFEGNGTLTVKSSQFDGSASFRVVLQKPDSAYLSIMGPFGIELAQAIVTKNNFIFYDALQNTAYEGKPDDEVLQSIFKINLGFNEMMDAFVGSVNLTENLYKNPDEYEVVYDKYVLTYIDNEHEKISKYKVDVRELGITDYEITSLSGKPILEGQYSKFQLIEMVAVPNHIVVQNKNDNQQITIDYKNVEINQDNIYIDFKIPGDATKIKW